MSVTVNVYDFDGTIYDGDSSIDFFWFMIGKYKKKIINIVPIGISLVLHKLGLKNIEGFKSSFFSIVHNVTNIDDDVIEFWKRNRKKIKRFYLECHEDSDFVISASPRFLLEPIAEELKFNLIATEVDKKTGKLKSKNCKGAEKVRLFNKTGYKIGKFYTDSKSDMPLCELAEEAYMVKGNKILPFDCGKKSDDVL